MNGQSFIFRPGPVPKLGQNRHQPQGAALVRIKCQLVVSMLAPLWNIKSGMGDFLVLEQRGNWLHVLYDKDSITCKDPEKKIEGASDGWVYIIDEEKKPLLYWNSKLCPEHSDLRLPATTTTAAASTSHAPAAPTAAG